MHGEEGVFDVDLSRAVHLFTKAANKGHANAKCVFYFYFTSYFLADEVFINLSSFYP